MITHTHTHIYRIISKFSCQSIENIFLIIYLEELINLNRYIYIMDFADIYIYPDELTSQESIKCRSRD